MTVSPRESSPESASTAPSVASPEGSMTQTARGTSSAATSPARSSAARAPSAASARPGAGSRSCTTHPCPARISRRTMFPPIRPRPTTPSCIGNLWGVRLGRGSRATNANRAAGVNRRGAKRRSVIHFKPSFPCVLNRLQSWGAKAPTVLEWITPALGMQFVALWLIGIFGIIVLTTIRSLNPTSYNHINAILNHIKRVIFSVMGYQGEERERQALSQLDAGWIVCNFSKIFLRFSYSCLYLGFDPYHQGAFNRALDIRSSSTTIHLQTDFWLLHIIIYILSNSLFEH